jgi:hypothetical protein
MVLHVLRASHGGKNGTAHNRSPLHGSTAEPIVFPTRRKIRYQLPAGEPVEHFVPREKADVAVGSAAQLVLRAHFPEASPSVGHAGR